MKEQWEKEELVMVLMLPAPLSLFCAVCNAAVDAHGNDNLRLETKSDKEVRIIRRVEGDKDA